MKTILESVRAGTPVEPLFIDVHGHFGPWPETCIPYATDAARVLAEMDRYGCDQAWISASNPGYAGDTAAKNDLVFDLAGRHPGRVVPWCTLSAHETTQVLPELDRCLARGSCIGVKMHRYRQPAYTLRSDFLQPVLERLNANRLVYLNHDFVNLSDLAWACEHYPEVSFLAGHFNPRMNDLALLHPNLFDCTCAAMQFHSVEAEIKRLGTSRTMLVGSDFPLFQLGFGIGMVAYADLDEADKRSILGLNALRLLRRTGWFRTAMLRSKAAMAG
jgi:predicted TIM-barrel fold metal-dependent hydrolase